MTVLGVGEPRGSTTLRNNQQRRCRQDHLISSLISVFQSAVQKFACPALVCHLELPWPPSLKQTKGKPNPRIQENAARRAGSSIAKLFCLHLSHGLKGQGVATVLPLRHASREEPGLLDTPVTGLLAHNPSCMYGLPHTHEP